MTCSATVRERAHALGRRLGERAHEPAVVAKVIALEAFAFSFLYYGYSLAGYVGPSGLGFEDPGAVVALLFAFGLTVGNAYAVTWLVWSGLNPSGQWRYRYAGGLGLLVGVLSHFALGVVLLVPGVLANASVLGLENGPSTIPEAVLSAALVAAGSVVFTAGIPLLLSVATVLSLTYYRTNAT